MKIEWNLINLAIFWDLSVAVGLSVRQNGSIENVFKSSLKVTILISQSQHAIVFLQDYITMFFQDHLIHGQCSRLIRTENVQSLKICYGDVRAVE